MITHHFVKSEDLNHHGTLYAGRTAEWFVEAGLMAAAFYLLPENIVCVKIHGMTFKRPVRLGETTQLISKIVYAGITSLIANIRLSVQNQEVVDGFITFVHVDKDGKPAPHGILLELFGEADIALHEQARKLHDTDAQLHDW